jgi:hypothetical protein
VKKELRPVHDSVSCDVCGRTILKGERTEAYQSADGRSYVVCELCTARAEQLGWIRASVAEEAFARAPRPEPRRSLFWRLRRRSAPAEPEPPATEEPPEQPAPEGLDLEVNGAEPAEEAPEPPAQRKPKAPRSRPKDPRHVRAVPTTAEAKVERALDLFNGSEHQRTVAGLARTLGRPWVAAVPSIEQPSFVTVVVAWELSWYRFRVDLGDAADPVSLVANGEEVEQIDETLRDWNATIDDEGRLVAGAGAADGGAGTDDLLRRAEGAEG